MTNLQRRVRKLESSVTDTYGLVPHTPEWLEFWGAKVDRAIAGEDVDWRGMTLDVVDAMIEAAEAEEATV